MQFEPREIHLPGGPVAFNLRNGGRVLHDFNIMPAGGKAATHRHDPADRNAHSHHSQAGTLHVLAEPGQSAVLRADLGAGEYEFYCSLPGHREAGMRGRLLVH